MPQQRPSFDRASSAADSDAAGDRAGAKLDTDFEPRAGSDLTGTRVEAGAGAVVGKAPGTAGLWLNAGLKASLARDFARAEACFLRALDQAPGDDPRIRYNLEQVRKVRSQSRQRREPVDLTS